MSLLLIYAHTIHILVYIYLKYKFKEKIYEIKKINREGYKSWPPIFCFYSIIIVACFVVFC